MTSRNLKFLPALAVLAVLMALTPTVRSQPREVIDDPEVYSVYAAAVQTRFSEGEKPPTALTLLQDTRAGEDCFDEERDKRVQPGWQTAVQSFRRENAQVRTIREGFDLGVPYSIVTLAHLRELMRDAGYPKGRSNAPGSAVFARFPGGRLVALSAVGFNAEKTRAMVAIQADCFPSFSSGTEPRVCREGRHVLLEKKAGRWTIVNGVRAGCIWIA